MPFAEPKVLSSIHCVNRRFCARTSILCDPFLLMLHLACPCHFHCLAPVLPLAAENMRLKQFLQNASEKESELLETAHEHHRLQVHSQFPVFDSWTMTAHVPVHHSARQQSRTCSPVTLPCSCFVLTGAAAGRDTTPSPPPPHPLSMDPKMVVRNNGFVGRCRCRRFCLSLPAGGEFTGGQPGPVLVCDPPSPPPPPRFQR